VGCSRCQPVFDEQGRFLGRRGSNRDVTEHKGAEEALRESETKYRIVADNTYDWEWWLGPENKFFYISPSCKRITDHEPKEFLEDPDLLFRITHPEDLPVILKHQNEIEQKLSQANWNFELSVLTDLMLGLVTYVNLSSIKKENF
jgi:PAS domain-containing protein